MREVLARLMVYAAHMRSRGRGETGVLGCEQEGRTDEVTILGPKSTSQYTRNGQHTFGYRLIRQCKRWFNRPVQNPSKVWKFIMIVNREKQSFCLRLPPPWPGQQWFPR